MGSMKSSFIKKSALEKAKFAGFKGIGSLVGNGKWY